MDVEFIQIEGQQGGWQLLFQKLHQVSRVNAGPQLVAKKPLNVIRNRYRDVLPIDSTRVVLDNPDNDYINANHVQFDEVHRKFILTQGPLEHTCPHFWQMVWENNSSGIVMLNKCVERGMSKCFPYWPHAEDPPLEAGVFTIENLGTEEEPSYQLSNLKLINTETNESRVILHYHYTKWPDFGVPQNPDVFLEFLYAVRGSGVLGESVGPCVIHCSAGIGRTGTFCLVDLMLANLEGVSDLGAVNTQSVLLDMRRQRLGLIQTPDQLRFSYIAILQGAIQDLHLETSSYEPELSESEEDSLDDTDSDDEEDEDERMERKYPGLSRQYGRPSEELPPPLPPRPPDTLPPDYSDDSDDAYERPPPPPTTRPPGPPTSSPPLGDEQSTKRRKLEDGPPAEKPPPVPARSLSPAKVDIYNSADPFLGVGRGGDSPQIPPPLPAKQHRATTLSEGEQVAPLTTISGGGEQVAPLTTISGGGEQVAPLTTISGGGELEEEERALLSELDELAQMVSTHNGELSGGHELVSEREMRRQKTLDKIHSIKNQMKEMDDSDWSVPWLLVGFVAVLGYCVYYVLR